MTPSRWKTAPSGMTSASVRLATFATTYFPRTSDDAMASPSLDARVEHLVRTRLPVPGARDDRGALGTGRSRISGERSELDVDRSRRADELGPVELTVRFDAEDGDGVGVLVGRVEECPRGIDVHPARPLSARRLPADHLELARVGIDLVHRDAVVTPVRVVEEPAA